MAPVATPVYLDCHATTPLDPRVLDAMRPWLEERFGNPHSIDHAFGRQAAAAVEEARAQTAALIGATPREIVFTSGATEANNLAIKGAARFERRHRNRRDKVVTLASEHKCVLESARDLGREGFRCAVLPVLASGKADMAALAREIDETTLLVSVMAANNEIGVLQPLAEIAALARAQGALFHTDAAQAAGRIPLDVEAAGIDLMSLSGHKLYGPKGIGALYVRHRPRARLEPLFSGGGQERGLRSGTLPAPLAVGMGAACALAGGLLAEEAARLAALRERFMQGLAAHTDGLALNGDGRDRLAGNINLAIAGVEAPALIAEAPELAFSTGSACTSAEVQPSWVLTAIGLGAAQAASSIRIGLGRFTTAAEVDFAVCRLAQAIARCRRRRPAAGGRGSAIGHRTARHRQRCRTNGHAPRGSHAEGDLRRP